MRALVVETPGGPEAMELVERALPEPGPGQVRVRVAASGVNRADLIQRRGGYPAPPGWPPDIPGLEVAGTVDALGPGVTGVALGDRVMAVVGGGGYAEAIVVPADQTVPVPATLDLVAASGVPEAFWTAWDAIVSQAGLTAGETLLVHAAGSGVGTAAIQIARVLGARTIGTSRTPWKLERARELGLEHAVLAGEEGWADEVDRLTDGRGVDVVLDLAGAAYAPDNLRSLAERGRWMVVGVPSGREATIDLRGLMSRRARITGTVLRARPDVEKAALAAEVRERLVPWLEEGSVRPVVDRTFPPEGAAEAHRVMEANLNFGTLSIVWTDES